MPKTIAEINEKIRKGQVTVVTAEEMVGIVAGFREATSLPLLAQPNAGRPQQTDSGVIYPEPPDTLADAAERFRDLGAAIIGGCCGSTPDHIRAIAARVRGG